MKNNDSKFKTFYEHLAAECSDAPNFQLVFPIISSKVNDIDLPLDFEEQLASFIDFCYKSPVFEKDHESKNKLIDLQTRCYDVYAIIPQHNFTDQNIKDLFVANYTRICDYFLQRRDMSRVAKFVDALYKLTAKSQDLNQRWNTLNSYAKFHSFSRNLDKALVLHQEALHVAEKSGNSEILKKSLLNVAAALVDTYSYEQAGEHFNRLLKILSPKNPADDIVYIVTFNNIAEMYLQQGIYDNALQFFEKKLALTLKNNDKMNLAGCYSDIGEIYKKKGYLNKAKHFYLKDLELCEEINHRFGSARALNNLGDVYFSQNNLDQAEDCYMKTCKTAKELNNLYLYHTGVISLAKISVKRGLYEKALNYLLKHLTSCEEKSMHKEAIDAGLHVIDIYLEKEQFNEANEIINKSYPLAKSINDTDATIKLLFNKFELDYQEKDFVHAGIIIKQITESLKFLPNKQFAAKIDFCKVKLMHAMNDRHQALEFAAQAESKAIEIGMEDFIFEIRLYSSMIRIETYESETELIREKEYLQKLLLAHSDNQSAEIYYNLCYAEKKLLKITNSSNHADINEYIKNSIKAYQSQAKSTPTTRIKKRLAELKTDI